MVRYNIYYKNNKINKLPMTEESVKEIMKYPFVSKKDQYTNEIIEMQTKDLKVYKCIVI